VRETVIGLQLHLNKELDLDLIKWAPMIKS